MTDTVLIILKDFGVFGDSQRVRPAYPCLACFCLPGRPDIFENLGIVSVAENLI